MMADTISRAAAIDYLMTNMGWRDEDGYEVDDADEKRAIITDLVNGIPAVDAVPVVRCRDCRYWRQEITPTEHWVCTQHTFDGRRMHTTPDFYCKDGMVSK